jgi:effector-binding domain-containing protein
LKNTHVPFEFESTCSSHIREDQSLPGLRWKFPCQHLLVNFMLGKPSLVYADAQLTAVVRSTIPRAKLQSVMGPAIAELMAAITSQGIAPIGPVFSHHLRMDPDVFDFEVGVRVMEPVAAMGRVNTSQLPAVLVARTTYHGSYEGLGSAWSELMAWITIQGLRPAENLWERYVFGPESNPNPATWRTELNRPLISQN